MPASPAQILRIVCSFSIMAAWLFGFASLVAQAQKVPEGFKAELIYQPPDIEHPSVVTCDDEGNLFVGEDPMDMRGPTTKEFDRIILIRWDKQTGRPVRTVFCQNLSAVFGLIWHEGALYVMHAPHYSMFQDTDGDGVADVRKDLADGFGPPAGVYGFNDHIVTGTRLGMDGRVYVSVGDKGVPKATGADGSTITLEGGGVVSMRLDGTQLEVVSTGTRNHLDVAMDSLDNIFTYDNTDDGLGWWTRFTHHVPTGYYGYPYDYLTHGERHLPRISEHGGGSPVGAACYRDAAWPAKYRENAFHCEWGKGKIQRFATKPNGATFTAEMEDFMVREGNEEFRPLDLCFSPDGKYMYVADWNEGGWCAPKVCGRLYRVSYVGGDVPAEPARSIDRAPIEQQIKSLAHPSHAERMRAQWQLARLGQAAIGPVSAVLTGDAASSAKVHAIWTQNALVDRVAGFDPAPEWIQALSDKDEAVCSQAARALGEHRTKSAVAALSAALRDPAPTVRMWSAIALGRIGEKGSAPALYAALDEQDPYARFAVVQALRATGDWQPARACLDGPSETARHATLLALTGVYDDAAVATLAWAARNARDAVIRAEAVASIAEVHRRADPYKEGWWGTQPARGKPARPKVHDWSATPLVMTTLREAVAAPDENVRKAAVRALVDLQDSGAVPLFARLATDPANPTALRADAARLLVSLKVPQATEPLKKLIGDAKTPADVLLVALDGVSRLQGTEIAPAIERWLTSDDPLVRGKAVVAYAQARGQAAADQVAKAIADRDTGVRQQALRAAGQFDLRETIPAIIAVAGDPAVRDEAILALSRMPDRRALHVYLDALVDKNPALRSAAGIAVGTIKQAVGPDIIELAKRNELPGPVRRELQAIFDRPAPLVNWQIIGPWVKPQEPKFDMTKAPDLTQSLSIDGHPVTWQKFTTADPQGRMSLAGKFKPDGNVWAMAYTTIEADADGTSYFELGRDDQAIVWVNGEKIYEWLDGGGWSPDQGHGPLPLKKGTNHIWFQAGNGGGPWDFSLAVNTRRPEYAFLYENVQPKFDTEIYSQFADKNAGDPRRGKQVFDDPKGVGCLKCHSVGGQGGKIGPDLGGIGAKYPRAELVRSVLEPSIRVAEGFTVTTIITDSGKVYSGILKTNAQDAVEILDTEGRVTRIPTDEIELRRTSYVSLMPNGLKDGLTLDDFADVIAYLESLK